jgi:hypothetical protein
VHASVHAAAVDQWAAQQASKMSSCLLMINPPSTRRPTTRSCALVARYFTVIYRIARAASSDVDASQECWRVLRSLDSATCSPTEAKPLQLSAISSVTCLCAELRAVGLSTLSTVCCKQRKRSHCVYITVYCNCSQHGAQERRPEAGCQVSMSPRNPPMLDLLALDIFSC